MKRAAAYAAGAILLAGMLAAAAMFIPRGEPVPTFGPTHRVAAILQTDEIPFWAEVWRGALEAAADAGLRISAYPFQRRDEIEALLETAILSRVDGILLSAPEDMTTEFHDLLKTAKARGIALVVVDADGGEGYWDAYIGIDNHGGSEMLADTVAAAIGEGQTVLLLTPLGGSQAMRRRKEAFECRMDAHGLLGRVRTQAFYSEDAALLEAAQETLLSPGRPDFVLAFSPRNTVAAAKIIHNSGLAGQVRLMGFGETAEALDYVEAGVISLLLAQENWAMGRVAADTMARLLAGERLETPEIQLAYVAITGENIGVSEMAEHIREASLGDSP